MFQPCISDGFWAKLRSFSPNRLPNYWIRNLCRDHPKKWRGSGQYSSLTANNMFLWRRELHAIFFNQRIKQCLYVLVMFSPDVIKIVSWMLSFKCVKKKVCISRKETWKLKQSCDAVSFSNNGFFVGKPSKSYQPSQTSESCGTFWF